MKNLFCIIVTYTQPLDTIESLLSLHREYLKQGYKKNILLVSGPQNPRTGGVIIGRFNDKQEALAFTRADPFFKNDAATYEILEFTPVLYTDLLKNFLQD